jgi:hydrogenase maturation protease
MFGLSLHDLNLVDTINIGRVVQKMPDEIVIFGVEVKRVAQFDDKLTPEVEAAMAEVIDLVMEEINK